MKKWISGVIMLGMVMGLSACAPQVEEVVVEDGIAVEVMTVSAMPLKKHASFSGVVSANKEVNIVSGLSGEVVDRLVQVGTVVKKDQVLLSLDAENVSRSVDQAKSAYRLAQVSYTSAVDRYNDAVLNLERNKLLYESGALSKNQYEQIETAAKPFAVDSAKLQLEQAKLSYESMLSTAEGASIKAPFDGVISTFTPEVGTTITPGQPLGSIVDLSLLKLTVDVSERMINDVSFDSIVKVIVPALGTFPVDAKITAIHPTAMQSSKLFPVEISFSNPDQIIKPGMFATVEVDLSSAESLVLVPYDAVLYEEEGYYVYIVENEKPIKRYVTLGDDNGESIEILSGVAAGDALVVKGQAFVKEDSLLNIIKGE